MRNSPYMRTTFDFKYQYQSFLPKHTLLGKLHRVVGCWMTLYLITSIMLQAICWKCVEIYNLKMVWKDRGKFKGLHYTSTLRNLPIKSHVVYIWWRYYSLFPSFKSTNLYVIFATSLTRQLSFRTRYFPKP